jgi:hypothetical protein
MFDGLILKIFQFVNFSAIYNVLFIFTGKFVQKWNYKLLQSLLLNVSQ